MDYSYLKTILDGPDYAALTDQAALDRLNEAVVTRYKKVDYSDVIGYLTFAEKIVGIVQSTAPAAIEIQYLATKLNTFDLNSAATSASVNRLLDALVDGGLISSIDRGVILGMAQDQPITRAAELNLGRVRLGDIEYARSLP
jgi:hypothetical protein